MSQSEVIKFLEKNKRWMSTTEISDALGGSRTCITSNLKRLFKHREIFRKEVKGVGFKYKTYWKAK